LALQPVLLPEAGGAQQRGLMIMGVTAGSPGAKAGLLAGDIMLALDDVATSHPARLAANLGPDSIGRSATVEIIRAGTKQSLALTIEAREAV